MTYKRIDSLKKELTIHNSFEKELIESILQLSTPDSLPLYSFFHCLQLITCWMRCLTLFSKDLAASSACDTYVAEIPSALDARTSSKVSEFILGGAATCSEGFATCFLKVPVACLGSIAAAVQPGELSENILQNLRNKWPSHLVLYHSK